MDRNFPIRPEPTDDSRFTLGLTLEVREVLQRHGYPTLGAMDVVDLQQILFRFLYRGVGPAVEAEEHLAGSKDDGPGTPGFGGPRDF